ncbi:MULTISPECIES: ABC transporter ATP-binding protein [Brevundimonas]|jgi:lipoprotein-releasing system ATP-binding protein|uniref:Lipoprotein-releasing system ATP-binding protein n=1 Tax=Brevundimonas halotolerans TaxID=69670 RepID=A0A7W9E790_9CAUL|nr:MULTISPECIES: ABC transporter ATP-binding protein [Brevundimonas]MAL88639.1 ABC transporter [Brevundimonas sp.]MAL89728.1 ABC transporter [Brevundimonas sp.]MBB5659769.1 lipoprotein-releasing system ATP-binding protein [Brevundimonas halotolerans]HAJ03689.1 ABC transporter [Brevundimonas sp.]HAV50980.1 ABC transporter [Brevundimonas sp.]|tara:strand:+ start:10688 stop:11398 length:711 start_codon:yes stop_codon:yes gene_type:complete
MNSLAPAVLSVHDLTRTYDTAAGGLTVLRGVNLDVRPGEIVGLIGPSGSGKSSLLHAAGLLEHPTSGEVRIDGEAVGGLPERARTHIRLARIGFVYQFHHLLPEFDARDNVALPLRIAGHALGAARARAEELLVALGLADRLTHQPSQLSGGERQRVAVARALANRPRLLLADEPTGNLDPATSQTVFEALHDLAKKSGVAALIATHNMELAGHMDRVFALKDGHLEERPAESQAY